MLVVIRVMMAMVQWISLHNTRTLELTHLSGLCGYVIMSLFEMPTFQALHLFQCLLKCVCPHIIKGIVCHLAGCETIKASLPHGCTGTAFCNRSVLQGCALQSNRQAEVPTPTWKMWRHPGLFQQMNHPVSQRPEWGNYLSLQMTERDMILNKCLYL